MYVAVFIDGPLDGHRREFPSNPPLRMTYVVDPPAGAREYYYRHAGTTPAGTELYVCELSCPLS